jgi:hypothetical protein
MPLHQIPYANAFLVLTIHIPHQPIHTLVHTPSVHCTTRHNTPIPIFELAQPQRLANLPRPLGARLILLVRKHKQRGVAQFFLVEHSCEFFRGGGEAVDVGAVDDEDYGGGVGVVAAPVRADGCLATEVLRWWLEVCMRGRVHWTYPDVKVEVLVGYRLDVESYCWYGGDYFANLCRLLARFRYMREKAVPLICRVVSSCPRCPAFVISFVMARYSTWWASQVRESISASLSSPISGFGTLTNSLP